MTEFNGGALHLSFGSATINGGTVAGNRAVSAGGGVWSGANARLIVKSTNFRSNLAQGARNSSGGGALYGNGGPVRLENCEFSDNAAQGDTGSGGAIYNNGGRA